MRALILAAGRGSRMKSLTSHQPKCLVPLAGRPLLEWQLAALREAGIPDIAVVRGYRGATLAGPGYTPIDNPRWSQTNMVGSLVSADAWLRQGDCIVSYSDIVYHPSAVVALRAAPGDISLTFDRLWRQLWSERFEDPLADAETFRRSADGRLLEIGRRTRTAGEIEGQYMGLLKFTREGWSRTAAFLDSIPPSERDRLDMTTLLARLLEAGEPIQTTPVEGRWCEVDSDDDLRIYSGRLDERMPWRHDWRWEEEAA